MHSFSGFWAFQAIYSERLDNSKQKREKHLESNAECMPSFPTATASEQDRKAFYIEEQSLFNLFHEHSRVWERSEDGRRDFLAVQDRRSLPSTFETQRSFQTEKPLITRPYDSKSNVQTTKDVPISWSCDGEPKKREAKRKDLKTHQWKPTSYYSPLDWNPFPSSHEW